MLVTSVGWLERQGEMPTLLDFFCRRAMILCRKDGPVFCSKGGIVSNVDIPLILDDERTL